MPRVSVILPFHNAALTLGKSLGSLAAQTYRDFELVAVDDRSTDGSRALLNAWIDEHRLCAVTVVDGPGIGPAGARNAGIAAATGDIVAFLDDDDWWMPEKLAAVVPAHTAGADIVCHGEEWHYPDGRVRAVDYAPLLDRTVPLLVSVFRRNPFSTSAVSIGRARLVQSNGFRTDLESAEDFELWLRLCSTPGVVVEILSAVLGAYRIRAGSQSMQIGRRERAMDWIATEFAPQLPVSGLQRWVEHRRFRGRIRLASAMRLASQGQRVDAMRAAWAALWWWPFPLQEVRQWAART